MIEYKNEQIARQMEELSIKPHSPETSEKPHCYFASYLHEKTPGTGVGHWVALAVIKTDNYLDVYCKDSLANKHETYENLEEAFKLIKDCTFTKHKSLTREQAGNNSCGPMALENIKIMAEYIKMNGCEKFRNDFNSALPFTKQGYYQLKAKHKEIYKTLKLDPNKLDPNSEGYDDEMGPICQHILSENNFNQDSYLVLTAGKVEDFCNSLHMDYA